MTTVEAPAPAPAPVDEAGAAEALMGRLFESLLGCMDLATVNLGLQLGLYTALSEPRTAPELAEATGIDARYAREWLEQQAITGLVEVVEDGDAESRRYLVGPAQHEALVDVDSPLYAGAMALFVAGLGAVLGRLPQAFRDGSGIAFGEYGDDVRLGQGLFNRTGFLTQLSQEWVPRLPGVAELLARDGAAVLDVGCGVGWSSVALGQAYPGLGVLGVDSDDASVMDARQHAAEAGLGDRVRFEVADAASTFPEAAYDVVFFFEALHDMAHPVPALESARRALRPGGVVVVMDENAEEEFAPGGSPVERLLAAASVLHCLPVGRAQAGSAATGALFRPATMRRYAVEAGFAEVVEAPIEHDLFRFYVLTG